MDVRVKYASNEYCGSLTFLPNDDPPTVIVIPKPRHVVLMVRGGDVAERLIEQIGNKSFLGEPYGGKETVWIEISNKDVSPDTAVNKCKKALKSVEIKIVEESIFPW